MLFCIHYNSSFRQVHAGLCKIKKQYERRVTELIQLLCVTGSRRLSWKDLQGQGRDPFKEPRLVPQQRHAGLTVSSWVRNEEQSLHSLVFAIGNGTGICSIYYLQDSGAAWHPQKRPFCPQVLNAVLVQVLVPKINDTLDYDNHYILEEASTSFWQNYLAIKFIYKAL